MLRKGKASSTSVHALAQTQRCFPSSKTTGVDDNFVVIAVNHSVK